MQGFFAYPSNPPEIGMPIKSAAEQIPGLKTWEANDIPGRFIIDLILSEVESSDYLAADITRLNFNVTYEIGFAIGKRRRIFLVKSATIKGDDDLVREVGIFDTLGYVQYNNTADLVAKLTGLQDLQPISLDQHKINPRSPVYLLLAKAKTDYEIHITSRIKKARLQFRSFDPEEQGRLSAGEAIKNVASSHGVIVPLIASNRHDAQVHNLRAAFVAGLTAGMEKELLLLQVGNDPVPLDYRDRVAWVKDNQGITSAIGDFASSITELLQASSPVRASTPRSFLASLNLGASSAENEMQDLGDYYLETDEYRRALGGEAQVVAGRKGSGKTALFVQLRDKLRRDRQRIILDLKPEGFQLLKFKDSILERLQQGTKEHTITAFWEYLIWLETCHKILEKDKEPHLRNHHLYDRYRKLAEEYQDDAFVSEGDFAERILKLTQRIADDFENAVDEGLGKKSLTQAELTNLLYKHDTSQLKKRVCEYLKFKKGLWILFDNLDKGWPSHGLSPDDLTILRCLLDAIGRIERYLRHHNNNIDCHGVVFIRNDVYELLLDNTSDRGKTSRLTLDWTDAELLRELLRYRFVASGASEDGSFEEIWNTICVSHISGTESSSYLIERSLMRPRCLLDLSETAEQLRPPALRVPPRSRRSGRRG